MQLPKSTSFNELVSTNIPLCSSIPSKLKEDKLAVTKLLHPKNIPAVFFKDEVLSSLNPSILVNLLQPTNKKSINSTFEVFTEVKLTFSKFLQFAKVYIILFREGDSICDKSTLNNLSHPSNI